MMGYLKWKHNSRLFFDPTYPDMTDTLDPDRASYYQTMIGVMRWMVEIGRIDIATE